MADIKTLHEKLLKIRESKTLELKPTPLLRTEIEGPGGKPQPLRLRYYQSQGIFHLLVMNRMILGDGTGLGKCVTADTLLSTDKGLIPIGDLAPKCDMDEDSFHEPSFPVRVRLGGDLVPVRRFYWNGTAPTYRVRTRDGYVVTGSAKHPIVVRTPDGENFVRLPDVEVADHFACIERRGTFAIEEPAIPFVSDLHPNAIRHEVPSHLTPDLARLLGYVVGEGTVTSKYHTVITQHWMVNREPHDDIRALLASVFGWSGRDDHNADRSENIEVASIQIRQFLATCGVGYTTARHKDVPWCVLRGTRESARQFLRSLFEGEASVVEGGVEYSTASERLSEQVQTLLLQFGITSTRRPKFVKGYDHTYWRITVFGESAVKFASDVGFVSSRKQQALDGSLSKSRNPNKDVVPHARELVERVRVALSTQTTKVGTNADRVGSGLKQFGDTFQSKLKHVRSGNRNPTYAFLRELYAACETTGLLDDPAVCELRQLLNNGYYYDPIVEVLDAGPQPVMDIEVDDPRHAFTANGFVNHNTLQTIGALCHLWAPNKEHSNKVIVVAPKSALRQWEGEVDRFTTGIKCYVVSGKIEDRKATYEAWAKAPVGPNAEKAILIVNYAILVRDWDLGGHVPLLPNGHPDPKKPVVPGYLDKLTASVPNLVTIFDEATAFKNTSTKTWQTCAFLSQRSHRCYGLTATLLKNNLMEGFSIYKVVVPGLFTKKSHFMDDFCHVMLQKFGARRIPIVKGYKNLDVFRHRIDPYFLGRPKHVVSDELPKLITRDIVVEMNTAEDTKYKEALEGILELGDGELKEYTETKALTSLIYCQQVVDSLSLLRFEEGHEISVGFFHDESTKVKDKGSKEEALVDLVTGELDGEKVIVYTRFEKLVGRLQQILKQEGIKSVRITGKETATAKRDPRREAQQAFQDPESDVKVIFITDAGSEAINLQAASAMIFYDAPWSWGNYVQLLGRPMRIGSVHDTVVVYHLIAERPKGKYKSNKTIDHHVIKLLEGKKDLVDKVLGESAVSALDFGSEKNAAKELLRRMQQEERKK